MEMTYGLAGTEELVALQASHGPGMCMPANRDPVDSATVVAVLGCPEALETKEATP